MGVIDDIFRVADTDHDGALSFEEFQQMVSQLSELKQHFAAADAVERVNDSKTSWSGRYEAVCVLAKASELTEDIQENSGELKDIPGHVAAEVLCRTIGLSPIAIGDFLAHKDPQCPSHEFARCYFARL